MLTAFQLFARTGISGKRAIDEVGELQSTEGRLTAEQELTELEVIHGAGQTLLASAASGDSGNGDRSRRDGGNRALPNT